MAFPGTSIDAPERLQRWIQLAISARGITLFAPSSAPASRCAAIVVGSRQAHDQPLWNARHYAIEKVSPDDSTVALGTVTILVDRSNSRLGDITVTVGEWVSRRTRARTGASGFSSAEVNAALSAHHHAMGLGGPDGHVSLAQLAVTALRSMHAQSVQSLLDAVVRQSNITPLERGANGIAASSQPAEKNEPSSLLGLEDDDENAGAIDVSGVALTMRKEAESGAAEAEALVTSPPPPLFATRGWFPLSAAFSCKPSSREESCRDEHFGDWKAAASAKDNTDAQRNHASAVLKRWNVFEDPTKVLTDELKELAKGAMKKKEDNLQLHVAGLLATRIAAATAAAESLLQRVEACLASSIRSLVSTAAANAAEEAEISPEDALLFAAVFSIEGGQFSGIASAVDEAAPQFGGALLAATSGFFSNTSHSERLVLAAMATCCEPTAGNDGTTRSATQMQMKLANARLDPQNQSDRKDIIANIVVIHLHAHCSVLFAVPPFPKATPAVPRPIPPSPFTPPPPHDGLSVANAFITAAKDVLDVSATNSSIGEITATRRMTTAAGAADVHESPMRPRRLAPMARKQQDTGHVIPVDYVPSARFHNKNEDGESGESDDEDIPEDAEASAVGGGSDEGILGMCCSAGPQTATARQRQAAALQKKLRAERRRQQDESNAEDRGGYNPFRALADSVLDALRREERVYDAALDALKRYAAGEEDNGKKSRSIDDALAVQTLQQLLLVARMPNPTPSAYEEDQFDDDDEGTGQEEPAGDLATVLLHDVANRKALANSHVSFFVSFTRPVSTGRHAAIAGGCATAVNHCITDVLHPPVAVDPMIAGANSKRLKDAVNELSEEGGVTLITPAPPPLAISDSDSDEDPEYGNKDTAAKNAAKAARETTAVNVSDGAMVESAALEHTVFPGVTAVTDVRVSRDVMLVDGQPPATPLPRVSYPYASTEDDPVAIAAGGGVTLTETITSITSFTVDAATSSARVAAHGDDSEDESSDDDDGTLGGSAASTSDMSEALHSTPAIAIREALMDGALAVHLPLFRCARELCFRDAALDGPDAATAA